MYFVWRTNLAVIMSVKSALFGNYITRHSVQKRPLLRQETLKSASSLSHQEIFYKTRNKEQVKWKPITHCIVYVMLYWAKGQEMGSIPFGPL